MLPFLITHLPDWNWKFLFSYSCSKTRPNYFILHFKRNKDRKRSTYAEMFAAGVTGCNISDSQSWLLYPMWTQKTFGFFSFSLPSLSLFLCLSHFPLDILMDLLVISIHISLHIGFVRGFWESDVLLFSISLKSFSAQKISYFISSSFYFWDTLISAFRILNAHLELL